MVLGACFGVAVLFGTFSAQRVVATESEIPILYQAAFSLGVCLWTILMSFILGMVGYKVEPSERNRQGMLWVLSGIILGTFFPIAVMLSQRNLTVFPERIGLPSLIMIAALSFGLGGALVGFSGMLTEMLFWKLIQQHRWGLILTYCLSLLLGVSAGWAAYGWTVFSSQTIFNIWIL